MTSSSRPATLAILLLVGFVAIGAIGYYLADVSGLFVPGTTLLWVRLAIVFVVGIFAIWSIERVLTRHLLHERKLRRAGLAISAFRYASYTVLALALLTTAGVNSLELLAGGTFAGLVLGLAGQTALSNIISGLVLLTAHPLTPGDRVTVTTWQFGMIAPAYPPKFYSHELVVPGYTGVVETIGIVYSTLRLSDGPWMKVPNSIMLQAAVLVHELPERWVRAKYEVKDVGHERDVIERIRTAVQRNSWVVDPTSVRVLVNEATPTSFVVSIDALCRGNMEEPPRSAILLDVLDAVRGSEPQSSPPRSSEAAAG